MTRFKALAFMQLKTTRGKIKNQIEKVKEFETWLQKTKKQLIFSKSQARSPVKCYLLLHHHHK